MLPQNPEIPDKISTLHLLLRGDIETATTLFNGIYDGVKLRAGQNAWEVATELTAAILRISGTIIEEDADE